MATKVRDYTKLASDIIQEVGGKDNIINATRCATRLRLVLKETADDAKDRVGKLPGVITVVENGGQFQVVIGNHVGDVYAQVAKELDLDNSDRVVEEPKQGVLNRVIATMSAVFAPFIYVLAAAGLLQGVLYRPLPIPEHMKCLVLCHGRRLHSCRSLSQLRHPNIFNVIFTSQFSAAVPW